MDNKNFAETTPFERRKRNYIIAIASSIVFASAIVTIVTYFLSN